MAAIRRILCPIDFSEGSDAALELAAQLARLYGAKLHVLHVQELFPYAVPDFDLPFTEAEYSAEVRRELELALLRKASGISGLEVETSLAHGTPHREITRLAATLPAELIVMGTHGRSGLARWLIGSVAERVVRCAPVPVITVPHPLHQKRRALEAAPAGSSDVSPAH